MRPSGIVLGLRRLSAPGALRHFLVAVDHGLPAGPLPGLERPVEFLRKLRSTPVTGVIANPGIARELAEESGIPPLIVHLSAGTILGSDPTSKVPSSDVELAVGLGAEALSVQIHFGSADEHRMVADAGAVVDGASTFGLPVLVMSYARANPGAASTDVDATRHAVRAAAELGASIVQTSFFGTEEGLRQIVRGCPVPLLLAGGPRDEPSGAWLQGVRRSLAAGTAGVTVGRNLFQHPDPASFASQIGRTLFGADAALPTKADP